jgi:hypothetical protein
MRILFTALVGLIAGGVADAQSASPRPNPRRPMVLVAGCAATTKAPHIWTLSKASARTETVNPGITEVDAEEARKRARTNASYELIGIADFLAPESSLEIGLRKQLIPSERVNATGTLVAGHLVAVKGMLLPATPPRLNVTSIIDLGSPCS